MSKYSSQEIREAIEQYGVSKVQSFLEKNGQELPQEFLDTKTFKIFLFIT